MARKLGAAGYIECSALNHINVKELFQKVGGSEIVAQPIYC
jgi:hypothetical protein